MPALNLTQAIHKLEKRSDVLNKRLARFPSAKKFFSRSTLLAYRLRQKSTQLLASAGLVGVIITSPSPSHLSSPSSSGVITNEPQESIDHKARLLSTLHNLLPHQPYQFGPELASSVERAVTEGTGIPVKATLEGQTLNHQVGYIGFEQHLKRFPGDTLVGHDELQEAGMAPGLGAFGYFSSDSQSFTTRDYLREKYYCVVQTLYLPNWNRDSRFLKDWYKFRKMLIINPVTGSAVVCAIGDAGPAQWTGKQFGASPEAMQALDLHRGPRKGLVLILFIDDPDNKIPLGPVKY